MPGSRAMGVPVFRAKHGRYCSTAQSRGVSGGLPRLRYNRADKSAMQTQGATHALSSRVRALRLDPIPPQRQLRPAAARHFAGHLVETSAATIRWKNSRDMLRTAFDLGVNAHRHRQQLWSAARQRRRHIRHDLPPGSRAPTATSSHRVQQSRLPHVGRTLRRMGLAQVPDRQLRPEPQAHGLGTIFDIFYSHRPDPDTPLEEDDGRAGLHRAVGSRLVRRHQQLPPRNDEASRGHFCAIWARPV